MPEISRFFGTSISMYFNDHAPPHFHVRYGGHKALVDLEGLAILEGRLPPRVLGFVVEWASLHRADAKSGWPVTRHPSQLSSSKPFPKTRRAKY